ncbi:13544_t:CDS:2 [Entrophospora sp. SA101]|nr:13544_t:CDS:2 [Entrophospora sp. SA101]
MTTGATRVYIGRLARDARERDVEKLFRGYGTIKEIKLMNGFGFVEFRDHRDADDVVYSFNGKSFMGEKGERRRRERDDRRGDRDDRRDRDRDRDDRRRDDRGDRDRGRFAPPQRNPHYRLIVENLSSSCSWQILHIGLGCVSLPPIPNAPNGYLIQHKNVMVISTIHFPISQSLNKTGNWLFKS